MTDTLTELATRIEQAEGPSRDLDAEIHHAIGRRDQQWADAPAYTASLDAAMTLVPEGMLVALANGDPRDPTDKRWKAMVAVGFDEPGEPMNAATPALALCAAALRARGAA